MNQDADRREPTALVILVPEAERFVSSIRTRYDPSAADGMPAHVTVLYPFKTSTEIDAVQLEQLSQLFRRHRLIQFALVATGRFESVLFLAPEPRAPFEALTAAVVQMYPSHQPYGGEILSPTPHLTVACHPDLYVLNRIEAELTRSLSSCLPIHAEVTEVCLMEKGSAGWARHFSFKLQGA